MTDDEVKEWEKKIKDSLLRKDSTLGNTSTAMKTIMSSSIEVNGKKYSLSSFGIKTQGYFSSSTNEKGVFHIEIQMILYHHQMKISYEQLLQVTQILLLHFSLNYRQIFTMI